MDITGDGIVDIVSGEYMGKMTLYRGSKDGFETPTVIGQATDIKDYSKMYTFLFTDPTFGDFNDDGLLDAFVGGFKGMRVMLNEGTKETPFFGKRQPLLAINQIQIGPKVFTEAELERYARSTDENNVTATSDAKTHIYFVDWDNDGLKDILSTSSYYKDDAAAINFHKGVKTEDGIRFENPIPLFTAENGGKALPGTVLIPHFCDMNNDGALDILLGVSITCNGDDIVDKNIKSSKKIISETDEDKLQNRGFVMIFLSKGRYK